MLDAVGHSNALCKERSKTSWSSDKSSTIASSLGCTPGRSGRRVYPRNSVIVPNASAPSARMRSPISHLSPLLQFLPATIPRAA
jgi:hypothetical protein